MGEIVIEWTLPYFLRERGWEMELTNTGKAAFRLRPNWYRDRNSTQARQTVHATRRGSERFDPDIEFRELIDGQIVGGMTYMIDPNMRVPSFWPKLDEDEADAKVTSAVNRRGNRT